MSAAEDLDVNTMNRTELVKHVKNCDDCGADDPAMCKAARTSSISDLRDYVATAHDPRWKAIAGRTK
ncbi:hypothetical protein [Streptosporangium jomthongense]|uniref:Uncharacterized protein n=1 Tax=Streptosporangium jomthongense TaxID=1193683 RepID=A0ABV8EVK3_9ACTN